MGRANSVSSQVDGDSDVVPACSDRGRAQQRNNGLCQHFCIGENFPSSPRPEARQFSSSPYFSGAFQVLPKSWSSKQASPSASKSVCGPFKRNAWYSRSPSYNSVTVSTDFHSQKLWRFLLLALEPMALEPGVRLRPLTL
ncbi:hypothetical protein HJG60_011727 [Phyllostomus discolor]|uniref:Uncharacterized protein n=1 Tax=Phyllostomus discolor TaxID=89673 RepID=A0A834E114_9CHIR|nr:hypothetical protein HJG60_011727 [Phyllostomus discolor]